MLACLKKEKFTLTEFKFNVKTIFDSVVIYNSLAKNNRAALWVVSEYYHYFYMQMSIILAM